MEATRLVFRRDGSRWSALSQECGRLQTLRVSTRPLPCSTSAHRLRDRRRRGIGLASPAAIRPSPDSERPPLLPPLLAANGVGVAWAAGIACVAMAAGVPIVATLEIVAAAPSRRPLELLPIIRIVYYGSTGLSQCQRLQRLGRLALSIKGRHEHSESIALRVVGLDGDLSSRPSPWT